MISRFLILLLISCFCFPCKAQEVLLFSDARSTALGSCYSLITGSWSCLSNPAGVVTDNSGGFGLNYSNYYGIPETATGAFVLNLRAKPGSLGIGFVSSGFTAINESKASLVYGRSIGKNLRAGIGISWLHYTQPADYRNLYAWIPSLGIQWQPGKKWITGLTVLNPAKQEYIPAGYRSVSSCIIAGAGFKPSDEFALMLEMQKIRSQPVRFSLGIETQMLTNFHMRFGMSRQFFFMYSAGIGFTRSKLGMDAAVTHHPVLGLSPSVAFNFKF